MLEVTEEERQRAIQRSRRLYIMDLKSDMMAEKRLAVEAERRKNIRIMLQLGLTIEVIAKAFELSEQDIKNIINSKEG